MGVTELAARRDNCLRFKRVRSVVCALNVSSVGRCVGKHSSGLSIAATISVVVYRVLREIRVLFSCLATSGGLRVGSRVGPTSVRVARSRVVSSRFRVKAARVVVLKRV